MTVTNRKKESLYQRIQLLQAQDAGFKKSHRVVQIFMMVWAGIVIIDRLIGMMTHSYESSQLPYIAFGVVLVLLGAFLGCRGHIHGALMLMQINMAVFCVQFAATCFIYRELTRPWATLFYGASALILVMNSLLLFLNRDLEAYRGTIRDLKGHQKRQPRFYRSNNRLIRNRK